MRTHVTCDCFLLEGDKYILKEGPNEYQVTLSLSDFRKGPGGTADDVDQLHGQNIVLRIIEPVFFFFFKDTTDGRQQGWIVQLTHVTKAAFEHMGCIAVPQNLLSAPLGYNSFASR